MGMDIEEELAFLLSIPSLLPLVNAGFSTLYGNLGNELKNFIIITCYISLSLFLVILGYRFSRFCKICMKRFLMKSKRLYHRYVKRIRGQSVKIHLYNPEYPYRIDYDGYLT